MTELTNHGQTLKHMYTARPLTSLCFVFACYGSSCIMFQSRARTRKEQVQLFWNEADFGYVDERLKEMTVLCEPQNQVRSLVPRIDIKNTLRYIYIYI